MIYLRIRGKADEDTLLNSIKDLPKVKGVKRTKEDICLSVEMGEQRIPEIIKLANDKGIEVISVSLKKPSLEDVFIHFTGKSIRDEGPNRREKIRHRHHMHRMKRRSR